jgi:hypothetical protein
MAWPQAVTDLLDRINATPSAGQKADEGRLNALSGALSTLSTELRERLQASTAEEVNRLISALEDDGPVGPREIELLRLWLVGDAESYVKAENDVSAWQTELDRLLGVLRQLRGEPMTTASMARMEAAVRDALRVTSDLAFFREQEDRVRSFEAATRQLTKEDKKMLAHLLTRKMGSPEI